MRGRRLLAAALFLALASAPHPVFAQQQGGEPPPAEKPPPDQGAVPRGVGGAIVKPAEPPAGDKPPSPQSITPPRPLSYVPPPYPPEAEKAGLEATVTLQLDVDKEGRVTKAVVVNPAGHGFDESALEAAGKLRFEPARRPDGSPVPARILYRYSFTLKIAPQPRGAATQQAPRGTQSLSGVVTASGSDVPIAGATVTLEGRTVTTDTEGRFRADDVAPGVHRVTVEAAGFDALSLEEELSAGEAIEVRYRIVPTAEGALEVTVRGRRPPREVTKRTLEKREIERIPGTNGDAIRSVQNLPGVARPPAIAGILLVRGSGPTDTQTFIDGTPVPLIYHFGGLSSVVPTELVERIDFYPGNFSTQYGRVMGGIVDAGMRSPKSDGYHGLVQVDLIDARALFEGPIPLVKGWTFAAAGRRSYVDAWLGPVLEAAGAGVTQAPVYYDYQLLAETNPSSSSRFRVAFFGSDDALKLLVRDAAPGEPALTGSVGLHTAFQRVQVRYENAFSNRTSLRTVFALGREDIDANLASLYALLEAWSITGRAEVTHKLSPGATVNLGADVFGAQYYVAFRLPTPPRPGQPPNQPFSTAAVVESTDQDFTILPAAYVEMELVPHPRAKLVPGLRLDYFSTTETLDYSPRLNGRYDIVQGFPRTTAKGGVGLFHQPPQGPQLANQSERSTLRSQRAVHYSLGVEQELTRQLEASVEGFYKDLDRQVVASPSASGSVKVDYDNSGTGYVVGSELLLKYKPDERFFGWLAYTLSRSARTPGPGEEERLVSWDQTHILTALGSYKLGYGWEVGARFRLVSGNLITPNVCNPSEADCDPKRVSAIYHAPSGRYVAIPFSGPTSERLPLFHALDLRVDKRWKFKSWQLSFYLDVQNVYNSGNAEAIEYNFNYTARQYISGIPLLPSFGLRADF